MWCIDTSVRGVKIRSALCFICATALSSAAFAQTEMTTGVIMERMTNDERFHYIAGVVEGLAYARYLRDRQRTEGMACINEWFYRTEGAIDQVYVAFGEFPDYPPGAVLSVVLDQVCG